MDQIDKYIDSLIAERNRVDAEISRLEALGRRGMKPAATTHRRKLITRKSAASVTAESDAVPSSRRSSDRS